MRATPKVLREVAPHWGAWIEIRHARMYHVPLPGRTPLGCVD